MKKIDAQKKLSVNHEDKIGKLRVRLSQLENAKTSDELLEKRDIITKLSVLDELRAGIYF